MDEGLHPAAQMHKRATAHVSGGLDWSQAWGTAFLEQRIQNWPAGWGKELRVLIYGDFDPPEADVSVPALGLIVHSTPRQDTVIRFARTVLEATVEVHEHSVAAVLDAARRINTFLGAWTLAGWGNQPCRWWSYVTHGTNSGVGGSFDANDLEVTLAALLGIQDKVRRKVDAALYWVREPRNLLLEGFRNDSLRVFSAYWNAFECLVDAVNILHPRSGSSSAEKQARIDDFMASRGGRLTIRDIQESDQTIVNPGFVGRASHALQICFPQGANVYIEECFRRTDEDNRLYNIRNSIIHGDVDAENPTELIRIESRLSKLWLIVWGMFGCLVPFPGPLDPDLTDSN